MIPTINCRPHIRESRVREVPYFARNSKPADRLRYRKGLSKLRSPKLGRIILLLHYQLVQRLLRSTAGSAGRGSGSSQLRKMIFVIRLDMDKDLCDAQRVAENWLLDLMGDTVSLAH